MSDWTSKLRPMRDDYKPLSCFAVDEPVPDVTLDVRAGLSAERKHMTNPQRRQLRDLRHLSAAAAHLEAIPEPGETVHAIIGGTYPLWSLVPAVASLAAPATIAALHVVTLS